jgi:hypothetical protein
MYGWGSSLDVDSAAERIVPSWEAYQCGVSADKRFLIVMLT